MIHNVLKIFQIIFVFSIFGQFKAQIKINWNLDSQKKNANITLHNESKENIIIPIDTTSLQPYYSDNEDFPFFKLLLVPYEYHLAPYLLRLGGNELNNRIFHSIGFMH